MKTWIHKPGSRRLSVFRNHLESCRKKLSRGEISIAPHVEGILLLDDDPVFCRTFEVICQSCGIPNLSSHDVPSKAELLNFSCSCAVIDYLLTSSDCFEVITYIEQVYGSIPIILISSNLEPSTMVWPDNVREFLSKSMGLNTIVDAAIEASEMEYLNRCILQGIPKAS